MRLKELREERKLTQWDVANSIKTSQRNIGRWENEDVQPVADSVIKLADFFGVSADYLLGRSDDLGYVTVQNSAPALADDEAELIALYRALLPEYKELALTNLRTWAGGAKSPKNAITYKA